jgi:hypothetical protein
MERTPTTTGSSSSAVRRLRMTEAHLRAPPQQQQQELEGASAAAEGAGAALRTHWTFAPTFDVREMTRLLDHDNHDMRQRFRAFAKHPLFLVQNNIPLDKEREVALQRTLGTHTSMSTEQPPISGYDDNYYYYYYL